MNVTSRVKQVVSISEADKHGNFWHKLQMDNGDKIEIGKRKYLKEGDAISYQITGDQQEYNRAKPFYEKTPFKGEKTFKADPVKQHSIEMQVCLKEAREWLEHRGYSSEEKKEQLDELISVAKYIHKGLF